MHGRACLHRREPSTAPERHPGGRHNLTQRSNTLSSTRSSRQKRMFDVGHTSSGMTFDLKCSSRLRLRSWGLDSVLLAGWNDLDLVAGVSFRVLVGAFLLERLACLLGHVLSRRFVGHGAPSLGARLTPRFERYAASVSMTHAIGQRRLAIRRRPSALPSSEGLALFFGRSSAGNNASEWTV